MLYCERCASLRATWFTPSRFGRRAGIFVCQDCGRLNIRLPGRTSRLEYIPVRVETRHFR